MVQVLRGQMRMRLDGWFLVDKLVDVLWWEMKLVESGCVVETGEEKLVELEC